jgi:MerR family transcriptional regulator, mercuric resistance operon regulatory protein
MNRPKDERTLRSGTLAEQTGVSADTLRFYERRGVLPRPPRDANGYRRYPPAAIARVRVIQRALDVGFTIDDLSRIFKQRDNGGAPCREVFTIASTRLTALEQRITDLSILRDELEQTLDEWKRQLDATPPGRRAGLLDTLGETESPAKAGRHRRGPAKAGPHNR